ncbi:MAG: hypothetical protein C5B56_15590 [Proteobacteria bacterium]|nr:MAG: hypothetical protein C5B56_15590 [Pseudomonadota bacterium]
MIEPTDLIWIKGNGGDDSMIRYGPGREGPHDRKPDHMRSSTSRPPRPKHRPIYSVAMLASRAVPTSRTSIASSA